MQGVTQLQHHVVGDVDDVGDGAHARLGQPVTHPHRRGADGDAPDLPGDEPPAALGVLDGDGETRVAGHRRQVVGRKTEIDVVMGGQVAGETDHGHRIGAVGPYGEIEDDVGELDELGEGPPQLLFAVEDQDPGVILTQAELALRADHPVRGDAANGALPDLESAGEHRTGNGHGHERPGVEVPGATDDPGRPAADVHLAYPDAVGVRVRPDLEDLADHHAGPIGLQRLDTLDLVTEVGEDDGQLGGVGRGQVDVLLQPAQ